MNTVGHSPVDIHLLFVEAFRSLTNYVERLSAGLLVNFH
jgi:hypothetical protein